MKGSLTRYKWDELMILFGIVPEPFHCSPCSVVAALVPQAFKKARIRVYFRM